MVEPQVADDTPEYRRTPYPAVGHHHGFGADAQQHQDVDERLVVGDHDRRFFEPFARLVQYKEGDHVEGRVYEFSDNFGTFVAVDDKYSAMIPRHEDTSKLRIGDVIEAKVTKVKPDGKLDVSLRDKAYLQMDEDAEKVMQVIEEFAGVLPFGDKASPEVIKRETGLSKNAFKRAVGRLYKEHRVEITERSIRKVD